MYSEKNNRINKLGLAVLSSVAFMSLFQVSSILATALKQENLENNNLENQDNQSEKLNDKYVEYYIYDGLKYELDQDTQTAKVIECLNKEERCIIIPNTIEFGKCSYKVKEIGDEAFLNCTKLIKARVGKNVVKIGKKAFIGVDTICEIILCHDLETKIELGSNALGNAEVWCERYDFLLK